VVDAAPRAGNMAVHHHYAIIIKGATNCKCMCRIAQNDPSPDFHCGHVMAVFQSNALVLVLVYNMEGNLNHKTEIIIFWRRMC
jgi:hypothetical protein